LLSSVIQPSGPRGPTFAIRYDEGSSPDIWPLEVGRSVSGTGRILLVCPEKTKLMAVAMGCSQGVETVELGALEYSIEVVGAEQVHVPLGVFDTLVIRYREKAYMEVFGRRKDRVVESKWWFSPELEFWVRRTGQQGDKVYIAEATDLLDE